LNKNGTAVRVNREEKKKIEDTERRMGWITEYIQG
jgi:hypothetical protein